MSLHPTYLNVSELPPRPEQQTGEPRPPRAPGFIGTGKPDTRDRLADPAQAPAPPPGQGPVLAWYKSSRRGAFVLALTIFVLITAGIYFAQGMSTRWMTVWPVWLVIVLASLGGYYTQRMIEISAGADWLQARRHWVKLYELTKVTLHYRGNNYWLSLQDRDDHAIRVSVNTIQKDRDMWDLVYNGILHSVIAGEAETNGQIHAIIKVPRPYPKTA
jgi:hypothetical protein